MTTMTPATRPPAIPPFAPEDSPDDEDADTGVGVGVAVGLDEVVEDVVLVEDTDEEVELAEVFVVFMAIGVAVAKAPTPVSATPDCAGGWLVSAFASWRKVTKLSFVPAVTALIAPTIPAVQCDTGLVSLQKNQMGSASFCSVRFHSAMGPKVCGGLPATPLSKPPASGLHGVSNELWVTE